MFALKHLDTYTLQETHGNIESNLINALVVEHSLKVIIHSSCKVIIPQISVIVILNLVCYFTSASEHRSPAQSKTAW